MNRLPRAGLAGLGLAALFLIMLAPSADASSVRSRLRTTRIRQPPVRRSHPRSGSGRNNGMMNQGNARQIASHLQIALSHLANADHDYQGHRVKAMHHVGTAIQSLQQGTNPGDSSSPAGEPTLAMGSSAPQAESDKASIKLTSASPPSRAR